MVTEWIPSPRLSSTFLERIPVFQGNSLFSGSLRGEFALTEDFRIEGGIVKSRYGTLGLLRAPDRPEIETVLVNAEDMLPTSFGAKGVGELCTIPTAPAIANAYRRLDGRMRHRLPLEGTPYRK